MSLNYTLIGKHIKEARKKRKLTQEKLSEIIDKSPSYISYIETGKKQLSLETLVDIANALKVNADRLLSYNIEFGNDQKDDFSPILEGCTPFEKKVITDTARALKRTLRDAQMPDSYHRY